MRELARLSLTVLSTDVPAVLVVVGSGRNHSKCNVSVLLNGRQVGGTDQVDLNIAALNSHDGTSAFRVLVTPVRVVCANTQSAALHNHVSSISIRHTSGATAAVQAARDVLGLTFAYCEAFQAEAERLIDTELTDAAFDGLVSQVFGPADRDAPVRARNAEAQRRRTLSALFPEADTRPVSVAPRGPVTRRSPSMSTTTPRSATRSTLRPPALPGCSPPTGPPRSSAPRGRH